MFTLDCSIVWVMPSVLNYDVGASSIKILAARFVHLDVEKTPLVLADACDFAIFGGLDDFKKESTWPIENKRFRSPIPT